jgi:hypothetical protein
MEVIDLTTQPPHSPYQKMEGLYMMPRTIDKLRTDFPGGKIGAYSITTAFGPGLSLMLLDDIGVTERSLLETVQTVSRLNKKSPTGSEEMPICRAPLH